MSESRKRLELWKYDSIDKIGEKISTNSKLSISNDVLQLLKSNHLGENTDLKLSS